MPYDKITYGKMLYGKSILREDIKTMVFSSAIFLLMFLPIVFILNYFCKKEYSNILLLIASLIFYAWGEPYLVLLMMFSVIINWAIGKAIDRYEGNTKKMYLVIGIVCDLTILGYYKYAGFFYIDYKQNCS